MLIYSGNENYVYHSLSGKEVELSMDELRELVKLMFAQKLISYEDVFDEHDGDCDKNLLNDLEAYADSVDSDVNTIHNFDMGCCDVREAETLGNVFNALERLGKKYKRE